MGQMGSRLVARGDRGPWPAARVPRGIPTGLAWHFSMLDYGESVAGLSIANHGSTLVDHPATVVTSARPYRVDGAELFCPDAVAAEVFITGIMAGQVNEC